MNVIAGIVFFLLMVYRAKAPKVLSLGLVIVIVNLSWGLLRHLALWYICRRKIVFNILKWDSLSLNNKPKITPMCTFLGPSTRTCAMATKMKALKIKGDIHLHSESHVKLFQCSHVEEQFKRQAYYGTFGKQQRIYLIFCGGWRIFRFTLNYISSVKLSKV